MKKIEYFFIVLLGLSISLNAEIITVDAGGNADFKSIQTAINASWDGDTIIVQPGEYPETVYFNNRRVTVTSIDPLDPNTVLLTILKGEIIFDFFENLDSVLYGFNIAGGIRCLGSAPQIKGNLFQNYVSRRPIAGQYNAMPSVMGNTFLNNAVGAINGCHGMISDNLFINNGLLTLASGGALYQCDGTIRNNEFSMNKASRGAAIGECHGEILMNTIQNNTAQQYGGGLYDCDGTIRNNNIENNSCVGTTNNLYGGGLSSCGGKIQGNVISGNRLIAAQGYQARGGGLYDCGAEITANQIVGNIAVGNLALGGGICQSTTGIINHNIIRANRVESQGVNARGGGLYLCEGMVANNIIDGNMATGKAAATLAAGGGLYFCNVILNNTVTGNRALNTVASSNAFGGGIYQADEVRNNIIAYNLAYEGGGIYGENIQNNYNLFWSNIGRNFGGQSYGKEGEKFGDPQFATNGTWEDNGSLSDLADDHWIAGDYHLSSEIGRWNGQVWVVDNTTSLGVDGGSPEAETGLEPNPNGNRINLGAFGGTSEASLSPNGDGGEPEPVCAEPIPADINGDCRVDMSDYLLIMSSWLKCNLEPVSACYD